MLVNNSDAILRLHISPLANVIYDRESNIACHIQVVRKVIRNFTDSFMNPPPQKIIQLFRTAKIITLSNAILGYGKIRQI